MATAVFVVTSSTHFAMPTTTKQQREHSVFGMSSCSNCPSISSDDDSELYFSFPEDPSDDNGEGYLYYDSLEPVVTEEEVAAYKESSVHEEEDLQEYRYRFHILSLKSKFLETYLALEMSLNNA